MPHGDSFGAEERDELLDLFRDVAEHHATAGTAFRVFHG
jgi:hypothetical protein